MTGFGQDGPYRSRQGFGTLAEAMSGIASVMVRDIRGFPRDRPALTSFPLGDVTAGLMGVNGIFAALWRRERSGVGEIIDLAIYEALLKFMELEVLRFADAPHPEPGPQEKREPDAPPRGVYRCRDGLWMALSGSAQPVAERILSLIGGERLRADPRFLTNALRVAHVDELDAIIEEWCGARTQEECIAALSAAGGAAGPVCSVETLLANPQVRPTASTPPLELIFSFWGFYSPASPPRDYPANPKCTNPLPPVCSQLLVTQSSWRTTSPAATKRARLGCLALSPGISDCSQFMHVQGYGKLFP